MINLLLFDDMDGNRVDVYANHREAFVEVETEDFDVVLRLTPEQARRLARALQEAFPQ